MQRAFRCGPVVLILACCSRHVTASEELVASAPPDIRSLLETGGVTLNTYDPATETSDLAWFHGSATFELRLAAPFTTQFTWKRDGKWNRIAIATEFQPVTSRLTHTIKVPHPSDHGGFWGESLIRHELDHVAITADPRPILLFERSLKTVLSLHRKLPAKSEPKSSGVVGFVNQELRLRREAIFDLIREQNRKLDETTQHGLLPLPHRDAFFRSLYEKESLDEAGFPYLAEVVGLLKEKRYQEARLLHLTADSE